MFVFKNNTPQTSRITSFIKYIIGTIAQDDIHPQQSSNAEKLFQYYNNKEINEQTGAEIENFIKLFVEPPLKKINVENQVFGFGLKSEIPSFSPGIMQAVSPKPKEPIEPAFKFIKEFMGSNKPLYKERILYITGDMGSGKTTLAKYITYSSLQAIIEHKPPLSAEYFPIYMTASDFMECFVSDNSINIYATLLKIFQNLRLDISSDQNHQNNIIAHGDSVINNLRHYTLIPTLFIIDGIDEIDITLRAQLFSLAKCLLTEFSNIKMILTFRTSILKQVLTDHNIFNTEQVFFIEKWSEDIIIKYIGYKLQNDTQLLNKLANNNISKPEPKQLWDKLSKIFNIKELSRNPFMLNAIIDLLPSLLMLDGNLGQNIDRIYIYDKLIENRVNKNIERIKNMIETHNKIQNKDKKWLNFPRNPQLWYALIELLAFFTMASPSNSIKIEMNYNRARFPNLDINKIMFGQDTIYLEQIITIINPFINWDLINEIQYYDGVDLSKLNDQNGQLNMEIRRIFLDLIRTNTLFETSESETRSFIKLNFIHQSIAEFIVAKTAAEELELIQHQNTQNNNEKEQPLVQQRWFHSIFFTKEAFEFFLEIISKENIILSHLHLSNFIRKQESLPLYPNKVSVKSPELLHIILNNYYKCIRYDPFLPNNLKLNHYSPKPLRLSNDIQIKNNELNISIKEFLKLLLLNSKTIILRGLKHQFLDFVFDELANATDWTNIKYLDISTGDLSSLPDHIGNLTNLETLYLYDNKLSFLPEIITKMTLLKLLDIGRNQISSLPNRIGNLTNLKELYLNGNQLTSLPDSIGNLTNLEILYIYDNKLSSLPDNIGNLIHLKELYIGWNQLTSLPDSIGNLTNLEILYIYDNKLSSLPDSIGNLTQLKELDLGNNHILSLPESIANLSELKTLNLGRNKLSSLPKGIGKLENLKFLNLWGNHLSPFSKTIKVQLRKLKNYGCKIYGFTLKEDINIYQIYT